MTRPEWWPEISPYSDFQLNKAYRKGLVNMATALLEYVGEFMYPEQNEAEWNQLCRDVRLSAAEEEEET